MALAVGNAERAASLQLEKLGLQCPAGFWRMLELGDH
jgi:hypothetical protein